MQMIQHALRKKCKPDSLFDKLNPYYLNIKSTVEKDPTKLVDTEITRKEYC